MHLIGTVRRIARSPMSHTKSYFARPIQRPPARQDLLPNRAGGSIASMTRTSLALLPLLVAGCAPLTGYEQPYAEPPSQQPVRSAFFNVPTPDVFAELEQGRIGSGDYPLDARRRGVEGEVAVVLLVQPDGRVGDCRVDRSSGDPSLDDATCRLIQQRFRYRPARDTYGNPVADEAGWVQRWSLGE